MTGITGLPDRRFAVESAFGSHPICITLLPSEASAAERFDVTVDLPIPPLPYMATLIILINS